MSPYAHYHFDWHSCGGSHLSCKLRKWKSFFVSLLIYYWVVFLRQFQKIFYHFFNLSVFSVFCPLIAFFFCIFQTSTNFRIFLKPELKVVFSSYSCSFCHSVSFPRLSFFLRYILFFFYFLCNFSFFCLFQLCLVYFFRHFLSSLPFFQFPVILVCILFIIFFCFFYLFRN